MPRKKSRPISNQKRKSLLNAYEEAFQNLPTNHPLRKARRKRRGESRGKLTKIKDGTFEDRWEAYSDPKYTGPNYQGRVGKGGKAGKGTKDRMPGTSPPPPGRKRLPKKGDYYIPTPFDKKKGKGYI